jgi:Raf kinase inhibitor-like YbhB/YbcL family protein
MRVARRHVSRSSAIVLLRLQPFYSRYSMEKHPRNSRLTQKSSKSPGLALHPVASRAVPNAWRLRLLLTTSSILTALWAANASSQAMKVASPTFQNGRSVPGRHVMNRYGCVGENRSPSVSWSNAPPGTRSFAVTLYDPDATSGSGWWHWIVYDIPPTSTSLPADVEHGIGRGLPGRAAQAVNDFGDRGYGGPCPPRGEKPHRYVLTVHALKIDKVGVPHHSSAAFVRYMIFANQIGFGSIEVTLGR